MKLNKKYFSFAAASVTLTALFSASGAPIPFYNAYLQRLGLDSGVLSLATVMYFAGTVIALLFLARLSNYWGRRRVIYLTLLLGIAGCLMFANIQAERHLLAARFLQGMSCGLASSTVAAFIIDNEPRFYKGVAAVIIGGAPNVGLPLGALGSGVFDMYSSEQYLVFFIWAAVLLLCLLMIFASRETVAVNTAGVWRSLVPQFKITPRVKRLLPAAAVTFAGSWAVGGFYQSYSAAIAVQQFGIQSVFMASLVFVSFIASIAAGASLTRGRDNFLVQRYSMLTFFAAMAGVLLSFNLNSITVFLFFNVIAGAAEGAAFTSSMGALMEGTGLEERAGVLSLIYLISYGGAALPNFIVSRIASGFTLYQLTAGYVVLLGAACLLLLLTAKRKYYTCG